MNRDIRDIVTLCLAGHMKKGESRNAFAKRVGVDQKTILRIMNKEMYPTTKTLDTIADKLGIEPWMLLKDGKKKSDKAPVENTRECCTPEECELLNIYRLTSPDHKALIVTQAKAVQEAYPLPSNVHKIGTKKKEAS